MTKQASDVSLGGETTKGAIAKAAMAAVGFIGTVVFAQKLGSARFGAYNLLLSLVLLMERPISGGWAGAANKRASEMVFSDGEIIGAQLLMGCFWVLILATLATVFHGWLSEYTGVKNALILFVVLLTAKVLYSCFIPVIQARGRIGTSVGIDAIRSYFTFAIQLVLVLSGLSVAGMVYGLAGATFLSIPIALYFHRTSPTVPSLQLLRSLWEYARYSIPTSMLWKTYDRFDVLLLGALITPAAVGNYEAAAKLTFPAMFVAEIAGAGLMVRVSNLKSKEQSATQDVSNVISFSSVLSIPLLFGAIAIARPLSSYSIWFRVRGCRATTYWSFLVSCHHDTDRSVIQNGRWPRYARPKPSNFSDNTGSESGLGRAPNTEIGGNWRRHCDSRFRDDPISRSYIRYSLGNSRHCVIPARVIRTDFRRSCYACCCPNATASSRRPFLDSTGNCS